MRKFLFLFVLSLGAFTGINADAASCFTQNNNNSSDPDFTVYFENDKYVIEDTSCAKSLENALNSISLNNCERIVLVGRADGTFNYPYNAELSQQRINYVKYLFHNDKFPDNFFKMEPAGRTGAPDASNPEYRVVRVYVDYSQCTVPSNISLVTRQPEDKIGSAYKKLKGIVAQFDITVWKDSEGEFNRSRLLSDSVAGVVLGTAGGLITSSIIKKNQLETGFEDINCTIGGQVVAGWDDEFSVGIK